MSARRGKAAFIAAMTYDHGMFLREDYEEVIEKLTNDELEKAFINFDELSMEDHLTLVGGGEEEMEALENGPKVRDELRKLCKGINIWICGEEE